MSPNPSGHGQHDDPDPLASYCLGTPCPPWCDLEGRHRFEHYPWEDPAQRWQRTHMRTVHTDTRWPYRVRVAQDDHTPDPSQPPHRSRAVVLLDLPGDLLELEGPHELRELAASLTVLAELLEQRTPEYPTARPEDLR